MNFHTFIKRLIFLLIATGASLAIGHRAGAQGCNQVEIKYEEPDCFKRKNGPAGTNGGDCIPVTACANQQYTYSAAGGPWASYLWAVTAGPASPPINPFANVANVNISWPVPGVYVLKLTVTDGSGNTFTKCLSITVKDKPVAGFTFAPNNACAGSTVNFTNTTTYAGTPYHSWNFGDPASGAANTSNLTSPTHIFNSAGTYTVMLIAYSSVTAPGGGGGTTGGAGDSTALITCCADTFKQTVTVVNGNVKIECISTVCAGAIARYTAVGCTSPSWGAPVGGTTLSTSANTITVQWGNGNPQGQLSVSCGGGCTAYATVPIVPSTPVITGNTSPCNTASSVYTVPFLPGTDYTWTLMDISTPANASGLLSTFPDNNSVWVDWPSAIPGNTYVLTIALSNKHLCCSSTGTLSIIPKRTFVISGPPSICAGQSGGFYPNYPGTFNWAVAPTTGVVPPSAAATGSYTAIFNTAGNFIITGTNTSGAFCNTTSSVSATVVPVPVPGTITGPATGCAGSTYAYSMSTPAPSGYYYEWTITGGSFQPGGPLVIAGDAVNAQWTTLPGTLTVQLKQSASPFCIIPAGTTTVTAATVGSIAGPVSVCVDGTAQYTLGGSLPPGTIINWTITPSALGTVTSPPGSNPVTILWHGQGGAGPWGPATVGASTGCGPATSLGGIMVNPKFQVNITQTGVDICQVGGIGLTANGAPAGSSYSWSPLGQTTQTITNITLVNNYVVTAIKGGCTATASKPIVYPLQASPIGCNIPICTTGGGIQGPVGAQILKPAAGTFTYEWHSGKCTALGPILSTVTTTATSNTYTANAAGYYSAVITYGTCQVCVENEVIKICCPDVNGPTITLDTQLSCNTWKFKANTANPFNSPIIWDFGDGTTDTGSSGTPKTHTYGPPGVYCVTFCVGSPTPNPTACVGNCAVTQATVPIAAGFLYTMGCNGCMNVTNGSVIYGNPGFVSYLWNFGDATTSTLQNPPQHCYTLPGTYTVTLTMTYNDGTISCVKTDTKTVVYTKLAIVHPPVCSGTPTSFSSSPGGFVTATWSFGDGITGYVSPIVHTYAAAGVYNVTLSVTDLLGNICTATKPDTVLTGIGSCAIQPGYLCPGSAATLIGPAGTYTYLWEVETSPNVFASAPGVNNAANYSTLVPGNYRVTVTNGNGCTCTSNVAPVTAVPKPKASFSISASKQLCTPGGFVTLTAPFITGYTYQWYANGAYGTLLGTGAIYGSYGFISSTTTFNLVITNQYGCTDTCSQTVVVSPTPAAPMLSASSLCAGVPITISVTNYPSNITWNNGAATASIVLYTAGVYIATVTNPLTGCSSSASITINRRPGAGLFPHSCDSIPCKCTRPFVLYAPKPLTGLYSSSYQISWYDAITNALLATGNTYNNGGAGVQTGSYYIVITDLNTNCTDTSNSYSVIVPKCDTCGCAESHWGELILTTANVAAGGDATPLSLNCKSTYTLACNKTYNLAANYICKDTGCKGKVTYSLLQPGGTVLTGNAPVSFTPAASGTYVLTLYGRCGGKICDSCAITFKVTCPCACDGSKWNSITMTPADVVVGRGAPATATPLVCGSTYTLTCKKSYMFNASFFCKDTACKGSVTYTLIPPSGAPTSGTTPVLVTSLLNGTYILKLYGWCGDKICDSCIVRLVVSCPCECTGSSWTSITMTGPPNGGAGDPPPVGVAAAAAAAGSVTKLVCKSTYDVECKKTYSINAAFKCKDSVCTGKVTYSLQPPAGTAITGSLPLSFTPTQTGTYTLTLYGWCGDKICDSCVVKFKADCECDCKGSKWLEKTLSDSVTTSTLQCKEYPWECRKPFIINGIYQCGKAFCTASASYKLIPATGAPVTGTLMPFSYTPSVSGTYTVMLYGYCGGKLCDSCVSSFIVNCPKDTVCCKYDIKVSPGAGLYTVNPAGTATIATQPFTITGLATAMLSEVRAEVLSYDLSSNFSNECLACKSFPYLWASVNSVSNIGTVPGQINLYGGTASLFNPSGAAVYQNPREVVWNNGSAFSVTAPVTMKFFLPPPSVIDCCEMKAKVCVRFTFRDLNCNECEVISCFEVTIKK